MSVNFFVLEKLSDMKQHVNTTKNREFIIVKNTNKKRWRNVFDQDPKLTGTKEVLSAYFSFDGLFANISISYTDLNKARIDLKKILRVNPKGGFAICPLLKQ